ncbi:LOW QUALITY PROTEIN: hypothetical protein HID58_085614 [Brassica napus]|uniref:Serpin domain-containing protein n=1 Tax=Brassica napus TaxID=3708 RepID=A0ABQ7XQL8_BRANA|nr:LOW QUALITY PROTEIN: hypothetical protein HID58_085614 [Brassica napus]
MMSQAEEIRMDVNKWASHHTNGLIENLLPLGSVTCLTTQIYGNALYFKGVWQHKFNKSLTKYMTLPSQRQYVRVPFMTSGQDNTLRLTMVLGLPYRQGGDDNTNRKFSMYFYLPDKKDGLHNLLEKMASTHGFLDRHIPLERVIVGDLESQSSRLSSARNVIVPKACVEIDEEGTEVVAVSARLGYCTSNEKTKPEMFCLLVKSSILLNVLQLRTGFTILQSEREKVRKSQAEDASLTKINPKKKNPSLTEIDLVEAMKKQNDVSMFLAGKVISTLARNSNLCSPWRLHLPIRQRQKRIMTFLKSASIDELNARSLPDGSMTGGPKIATVNGVWIEKSRGFSRSCKDLLPRSLTCKVSLRRTQPQWLVGLRRRLCLRAVEQTTDSASQSSGSLKFVSIVERCSFDGGSIHRDGGSPGDDLFGLVRRWRPFAINGGRVRESGVLYGSGVMWQRGPLRWLSFEGTPVKVLLAGTDTLL